MIIMTVPRDPVAPVNSTFTPTVVEPIASTGARVGAALGGLVVLLGGAIVSLGAILVAPLGMLIGAAIWRQRGKTLPVVGHWVASLCGAAIVVFGLGAVTAAMIPRDTFSEVQKTIDSISRATPQPPARTPAESARRAAARRAMNSPKAMQVGMAYGFGFAAIFMALIAGTVGWVGGMLVGFAAKGRWPGSAAQPSGNLSLGGT
jgi:hypothetical protein